MDELVRLEADVFQLQQSRRVVSFSPETTRSISRKKPKPPPSVAQTNYEDLESALKRIEDGIQTAKDVKLLEKRLASFRRRMSLPMLPAPLDDLSIPDRFDAELDPFHYAKQFGTYVDLYNHLNKEEYTEAERRTDILAGLSYLYNAKNFKPSQEESPREFYDRCVDNIDQTLVALHEKAENEGQRIESIFMDALF